MKKFALLVGAGSLGAFAWFMPAFIAGRIYVEGLEGATTESAAIPVVRALAVAVIAAAASEAAGLLWRRRVGEFRLVATCVAFIAMSMCLSGWVIDDAAITFAYSQNLVEGHGLTLHPSLEPQEAYSNTLWMLWAALLGWLGLDIVVGVKVSSGLLGLCCIYLIWLQADGFRSATQWAVASSVALGAPFLVWANSGLEHVLQALMILGVVWAASLSETRSYVWTAIFLSVLVLIRPEAPLLVASCFAVHLWIAGRSDGIVGAIGKVWLVAGLPFICWVGLMGFRLAYFGDPFPNPFYAKTGGSSPVALLNPLGWSWHYVSSWAYSSGFIALVPVIVLAMRNQLPVRIAIASALFVSHISFVLFAPDWMGCWRFIAPLIPLLAVLACWAVETVDGRGPGHPSNSGALVVAICLLLWVGTVRQYVTFVANPTTPYAAVARIGDEIKRLMTDVGVQDPLLAHHDAGGTSFHTRIRLLDLGGLGDRRIAQSFDDPEQLANYVLQEKRPDFVFGSRYFFAAGISRFWETQEFRSLYVPVRFVGKEFMNGELAHILREHVEGKAMPSRVRPVTEAGVLTGIDVY